MSKGNARVVRNVAMQLLVFREKKIIYKRIIVIAKSDNEYNHSGDDGKEVPPVPIPNTEVKLFYAESTCRLLPGGQVIAAFQKQKPCS